MFRNKIIFLLSSLLLLSACAPAAAPEPTLTPTPPPTGTSTITPTNTPLPTDTPTPSPTPTPEASLTKEMQDMGLRLEKDEDGRTIAVDERGYMRFYEKDGEWVDWYQELIDEAKQDFWDEWGEYDDFDKKDFKRINIHPIWTGEIEENSMALDGVNVSMQNLVCVIADPVRPDIIREVLVPIKIALSSGELLEAPGMFFRGDDFFSSAEEVLNKISPGDQFEIDIYTRAPYSDSWCRLTRKCGPPIMINQLQGLTDLFTQIFDENDSSQWPEELIVPAFNIMFYKYN